MYADIQQIKEFHVKVDKHGRVASIEGAIANANKRKISKFVNEYNAFKKNKLQNFQFNTAKLSTNFGMSQQGSLY